MGESAARSNNSPLGQDFSVKRNCYAKIEVRRLQHKVVVDNLKAHPIENEGITPKGR